MAKSKNSESERLDDASMLRVIELLEPTKEGVKPGTKKDACQILGIAYNTTRLGTLIEKFKENKAREAAKRAEKRGKPATQAEIDYAITNYLEGATVDSITKTLFRSASFVTGILHKYGVPIRSQSYSYFRPGLVPDEAMRDRFAVGEKVYSMRYDCLASIEAETKPGVYRIYLLAEKWLQNAYQPAEELASLEHLRKLGINI